jgi:serralysin
VFALTGTSQVNSPVSIFVDGSPGAIASAIAGTDRTWTATVSLSNNIHTLTANAIDPAGNSGASGNNVVVGSTGNNVLSGTAGSLLTGGGGNDTFVFTSNFGRQTVTDFHVGGPSQDAIEFSHDMFATFADVMAHPHQVGSDTIIAADASHVVALANVNASTLHSSNFLLV